MCVERESEEELVDYEYIDGSGEASSHPADEPGSFGVAKSAGDAKSIIEHFTNIDYQIISGRRPLVFHEESFGISIFERFLEAHLVAGSLIEGVAAGAPAPTAWPACCFLQHVASHTKSSDGRPVRGTYGQLPGRAAAGL